MGFLVLGGHFCNDGSEFDFDPGDTTVVGEAPRCPTCGRVCGMLPLVPPIRGTLIAERAVFDLSASAKNVLVSERCLKAFDENGISGLIERQSIELLSVEGPFNLAEVGRFFWAQTRCGAEIDRLKSNLRTTTTAPCTQCGFSGLIEGYDRVALVESSWNGSDLFWVKGLPGVVLVTERVGELCRRSQLKVCNLAPAEDYAVDFSRPPTL